MKMIDIIEGKLEERRIYMSPHEDIEYVEIFDYVVEKLDDAREMVDRLAIRCLRPNRSLRRCQIQQLESQRKS